MELNGPCSNNLGKVWRCDRLQLGWQTAWIRRIAVDDKEHHRDCNPANTGWLVSILLINIIDQGQLCSKREFTEVNDNLVALTGDNVEIGHFYRSFEESAIRCNDVEGTSIAELEAEVACLCSAKNAEAVFAPCNVQVWLDFAIDTEQIPDLSRIVHLVEVEGAIPVEDVIAKNQGDVKCAARKTKCQWVGVIFVVRVDLIELIHHPCEAVIDISSRMIGDVVVIPDRGCPV